MRQVAPWVDVGAASTEGTLRGRFSELDAAVQDEILRGFMDSGLALRRQGFQALKSLCCLAYYQDPSTFASIRYSGPLVQKRW